MRNPIFKPAILAASIAVAFTGQVQAKEIEEVIVTAQKREQTLQDVPSAVSAITPDQISSFLSAGENIRAIAGRVPSLQVESSNGRQSPRFYIRGLGNYDFDVNAVQPVSLVYDDVALENSVLKSLPMFDVAQVEVLNGPQGTLFGRSTTAGVVKIDSVKPTYETEGYTKVSYGSRGTLAGEGAIGGGLSENVAARASIKYQERDAWIDNIADGESGDDFGGYDEFAYRLQFLFDVSEDLSVLTQFRGFHQDGDQPQIFYANGFELGREGLRSGFDYDEANHNFADSGFEADHFGTTIKVEAGLGEFNLTSITAYDEMTSSSGADVDGGVFVDGSSAQGEYDTLNPFVPFTLPWEVASRDSLDDHYQLSQELRLSRESESMFYQVGVYYFKEDVTIKSEDLLNDGSPLFPPSFLDQETTSAAVFGQLEYFVSDNLSVLGGLRYTSDDKEMQVGGGEAKVDDDYISWELALNYDVNEEWVVYARAATASRGPTSIGRFGNISEADTETITSIETGFKANLGRVRWNATVYSYTIEDQQLVATGGAANFNALVNADETEGYGFETDVTALLTDNLSLNFNMSYNKTEINDDSLSIEACGAALPARICTVTDNFREGTDNLAEIDGNPLPRAPEWLANISLSYEYPVESGRFHATTDWNYRSESNIFLYESVEFVAEERWIGGVRIGYENEANMYDISLVGRNITNEIVADGAIDFNNRVAFINEPRFIGVEVSKNF